MFVLKLIENEGHGEVIIKTNCVILLSISYLGVCFGVFFLMLATFKRKKRNLRERYENI